MSKIIARIDKGSWSHCGIYRGNGQITEAIPSGVTTRSIENYKKRHINLGVYRTNKQEKLGYDNGDTYLDEATGFKYGFLNALILGARTIFGFTEEKFTPAALTPNGNIYYGDLYLVDYL